ncbi:zf-HC2 domain-containing protein [Streptomyces sp. NPDC052179]|uniref:zf-HC2 domain-containing protein n=1 Tax=Streptomyces sp. NPDC052179 TaxID=3155680 RepID=UPI00342E2787
MTATTDTAQHPDVSEISDLTEGLLSPSRAAEVRSHVDGCALCGDVRTSLEEIRGLLGTLPGPQPMPEDIAGRIDAALAAEALLDATVPESTADVSRETSSPTEDLAPRTTALPDQRTTSPPAGRPAGRPRAATGPGRHPSRRRRRAVIIGTAFGAAVIAMSAFLLQQLQTPQDTASSQADSSAASADSSTQTFSEGTLEGRVQGLLSSTAAPESPDGQKQQPEAGTKSTNEVGAPDSSAPKKPLRTPTVTVPPCVQQATGRNTPALALDKGRYQGTGAFLVVLPHATDATRVQAYVVDATCVDATPETKGRLLLTHSYDRP